MVSSDPTFCENEDEKGDTIRTENYITMLRGKVLRVLKIKQKHDSCIFNKTDPSSLLSQKFGLAEGEFWKLLTSGKLTSVGLLTALTRIRMISFCGAFLKNVFI